MNCEYKKLFGLRNKATGNLILYYWSSSQKHKAIFSSEKKANDAKLWIERENVEIEIVEFD